MRTTDEYVPGTSGTLKERVTEVIENEVGIIDGRLAVERAGEVIDEGVQEVREETLRLAAEYLRKKYGITNRAAGDLLRLAELETQGRSALGPQQNPTAERTTEQ